MMSRRLPPTVIRGLRKIIQARERIIS